MRGGANRKRARKQVSRSRGDLGGGDRARFALVVGRTRGGGGTGWWPSERRRPSRRWCSRRARGESVERGGGRVGAMESPLCAYELRRLETIRRNQEVLRALGLAQTMPKVRLVATRKRGREAPTVVGSAGCNHQPLSRDARLRCPITNERYGIAGLRHELLTVRVFCEYFLYFRSIGSGRCARRMQTRVRVRCRPLLAASSGRHT